MDGLDTCSTVGLHCKPPPLTWSPALRERSWPLSWTPETPPEDEVEEVFDWPVPSTELHQDRDLFELLARLQGSRLDDQRVTMGSSSVPWTHSRHRLESLLRGSPPYPMVALPPEGGFWSDPSEHSAHNGSFDSEGNPGLEGPQVVPDLEESCRTYRAHFLQSEHFNFCGLDEALGPVVLSVKYYTDSDTANNHIRIILRLTQGTSHQLVARQPVPPSPIALAKSVCPDLSLAALQPVLCPKASDLLLNYDEHVLVNNFKFGLIYQRVGQTTEEALFGNRSHSSSLDCLLDCLGERVTLSQHLGYRGGLDTQFGQTGQHSVYTDHCGKEVMFHVSTLLPFSETDSQQLQRKRHIGNDIVSVVFQEGPTPFSPDMVTSHFLHAYIVVQPEDGEHYRVTVTARADVPYFGPPLPSPPVFRRGPQFRDWILNKLINAETACYRAEKFSKLEQRTRASLLANLVEELTSKTQEFLEVSEARACKSDGPKGFLGSVRKVLAARTRSTLEDTRSSSLLPPPALPRSLSSYSALFPEDRPSGGDSGWEGSRETSPDTGEQETSDSSSLASEEGEQRHGKLQADLARLKVDKLELLRQNVAAQREVKRLRERELQLQSDLTTASREINRLRLNVKREEGSLSQGLARQH